MSLHSFPYFDINTRANDSSDVFDLFCRVSDSLIAQSASFQDKMSSTERKETCNSKIINYHHVKNHRPEMLSGLV